MRLTEQQESLISQYVKDVRANLADMSGLARERALAKLRLEIVNELAEADPGTSDEESIKAILDRCGSPSKQARALVGRTAGSRGSFISADNRRWLGVCGGLAQQIDLDPGIVRLITFVLGLLTGPFALVIYLGVYFAAYFTTDADVPRIGKWTLFKHVVLLILAVQGLHWGTQGVQWLASNLFFRLFDEHLILTGRWAWLQMNAGDMRFWVFLICMPLTILAALPVPKPWSQTLSKVVQAFVALYAVALCFGLGATLAGAIIQATNHMSGPIDFESFLGVL